MASKSLCRKARSVSRADSIVGIFTVIAQRIPGASIHKLLRYRRAFGNQKSELPRVFRSKGVRFGDGKVSGIRPTSGRLRRGPVDAIGLQELCTGGRRVPSPDPRSLWGPRFPGIEDGRSLLELPAWSPGFGCWFELEYAAGLNRIIQLNSFAIRTLWRNSQVQLSLQGFSG
jgi:hypothetical protein